MFCPSLLWFDHDVFYPCLPWSLHRSLKNPITTTVTREQHWRLRVDTSHVYTFTKDYGVKKLQAQCTVCIFITAQWRLKSPAPRLFAQPLVQGRSKKTPKLRATGLCDGNPTVTGGLPSQRASNAEKGSIWWRLMFMGYPECTHRPLPDEGRG